MANNLPPVIPEHLSALLAEMRPTPVMKQRQNRRRMASFATPEASRAHDRVRYALARGHIMKPLQCESCGEQTESLEAAHEDYSRPLDVRWLCVRCHRKWDSEDPKGGTVTA